MELIGGSYRSTIGIAMNGYFSVGFAILPAVAYYVRPWRQLQLALSVPSLLTILYWW
jgi:OCT family organic cation transporter-like MFS transporter 4/5